MDIVVWLRTLGLEQYEATFRDNAVDDSVLPDLTDQDLEKLGVLLGHRRKLLRAIANLETVAKAASGTVGAPVATDASPRDAAERRQVTVMFSDLVGSTALSARMDPEDLREVISAYQKCVAETVQRFGGFVAKYMGDGVLIYFGYPQAHEDDAERAVRAGLDLVAAVGGLTTHAPLKTRVGIATGLVVVGDLIGSGASQEQAIVGETPNLAARLQSIAEPNRVVIAESTRKLVGSLFEIQDLGTQDLKGIARPVQAWAALRPASVESRFDALHATGLTELVGRDEELDLLLRRWSKSKAGEGQVVLLSGEPGIGKSRLTAALLERLATEPHTRLRNFCSPQHTDSALYPTIGQIERAAGFAHDDNPQKRLDKLDVLLMQSATSPHDAALLAEMLSLPNDGRYPTLELTAQQQRQKTLGALVLQVAALAHQNPVLTIFEDAHWADPTSLELLGRIVDKVPSLRVLLIVTFRPEFDPPWIGRPYVTALTLNRLGEREIGAMIDRVTGNKALPESIRHDIVERTDGIPLFVEEMTKAVLEAGGQEAVEQAVAEIPSPSVIVPASLHASLMARLDRLGSAKEIAQIGAAIGREFSHLLLAAVAGKTDADLGSALNRLIEAGLLFRQGEPPQASYLFKHGLVQDAAYSSLLRERRRGLHARVAETLEKQFPEVSESQPELVARHCTDAGLIEKAAALWAKAGRRSLARSALVEAIAQLTRALHQIATLPSSPVLRREELELQAALITPLMNVKGFAAPEAKAAMERARLLIDQANTLGESPEDPVLLYRILFGFWIANVVAFNADAQRELAAQFLSLAEKQGSAKLVRGGNSMMGVSLLYTGDFVRSRTHYDHAVALVDQNSDPELQFGQDWLVSALCYRAILLWMLGYPTLGIADTDHSLNRAREIGHLVTLLFALNAAAVAHFLRGNYPTCQALAHELFTLADEKGAPFWKPGAALYRGWLCAVGGKSAEAIQSITSGIAAYRSTGSTLLTCSGLSYLAKSHADIGQFDDAWRCVDEAQRVIKRTEETWFEADVARIAGEIALMPPQRDVVKAEAFFERALAVARQQQAKSWELRAAMSLARLLRSQGKVQQARELLAPIYGWFTEGFDTRDLKEAKALLEELAS
jgi:class 3 adenylate cyclase/predicted ATPase